MCVQHNSSSKLVVVARPSYSSRLSENEADEKALKELQKALKDPQDPIYSELYIAGNFSVRKLPFQAAIQFTCEPGDLEFPEEGMRKLASRFPDLEFAVRYEIATDHFETYGIGVFIGNKHTYSEVLAYGGPEDPMPELGVDVRGNTRGNNWRRRLSASGKASKIGIC